MDIQRFDGISKAFAGRFSRRRALQRGAQGGLVAAAISGVAGRGIPIAAAETRTAPSHELDKVLDGICLRPFEVTVRQGPDAGQEYLGALALKVGEDGAIDQGVLATVEGDELAVVGQVTGRAISLLITTTDGGHFYGVGTGEQEVSACAGALGGTVVGPEPGDSGDWAVVDLSLQPAGRRSQVCKSCLQSCRRCFGFCLETPDSSVCRDACMSLGSCSPDDFV